jgi:hypothetical protein
MLLKLFRQQVSYPFDNLTVNEKCIQRMRKPWKTLKYLKESPTSFKKALLMHSIFANT